MTDKDFIERKRYWKDGFYAEAKITLHAVHGCDVLVVVRNKASEKVWSEIRNFSPLPSKMAVEAHIWEVLNTVTKMIKEGNMVSLTKIDESYAERTASAIAKLHEAVDAILDAKRLEKVFGIKQVIFNDPATIVMWTDGTKSVVKAQNEAFDPEKGLAMAIARKALGNKHSYYDTIRKHTKKYKAKK